MANETISSLSSAIAGIGADLYVVPMNDEFQSEYVPECAARLPYLTGFTGSAGLGAFWANSSRKHALFVDGRYTLQAAQQIDAAVIEVVNSGETSFPQWLQRVAGDGITIAFDPWLISEQQLAQWTKATANVPVRWNAHSPNVVDEIWAGRPANPTAEITLHPLDHAGESYGQKRDRIVAFIRDHKANGVVLTQPDGINWLLNIRGGDVAFNPLVLSYMVLGANGDATLYMHPRALSGEVAEYLAANQVTLKDVAEIYRGISLPGRMVIDPSTAAHGWFALDCEWIVADDPTLLPKAKKNPVELAGMRAAHGRDGLALTRFLHWFDATVGSGTMPDELGVVDKLESIRRLDNSYHGPSFATIAGSGSHGAIVHYRADAQSNRHARPGELFLLDSGGQYPDGTTDVTRTLAVGKPSVAMKEHFTRVLKGHIALAAALFPEGTSGIQLDSLARHYLWSAGLDYDHGTGHGVGAYLCVHEGPQRISKRGSNVALEEGMILSNEPGYYMANHYGIRIENLVTVVARGNMADGKKRLGFETLTLAPIDTRLVEVSLLNIDERNWLNAYHQQVYKAHEGLLDESARQWLIQATKAV